MQDEDILSCLKVSLISLAPNAFVNIGFTGVNFELSWRSQSKVKRSKNCQFDQSVRLTYPTAQVYLQSNFGKTPLFLNHPGKEDVLSHLFFVSSQAVAGRKYIFRVQSGFTKSETQKEGTIYIWFVSRFRL